ncbi:Phosphatidylglycerol phospholipase C [Lachnellula suecica]|uniref:Phosphatidylglycerol phospholipase C n=1 Tax=Lachnellula suecica TaxID=602035 RepID=A0A8T9CF12_9HELO|nr:Phosphatidylglycerol phospholipase C [Lachnellula suecica]
MGETLRLLQDKMEVPLSTFTFAKSTPRGKKPQAIAHRGYKAANPENTMGAFKGAVKVGAHAIETDTHLSRDNVVVLSHDPTLKRCFGEETKIADCDWEYLKTLRTLKEPRQPMPRLKDLLEYLAMPGLEDIWVLLDVKLDDKPEDMFRLIAATLAEVPPSRPWNTRIIMGCWSATHVPLCSKYLPGYPITHIGFNIGYARQFLKISSVSFNMAKQILVGPCGKAFLRDVRKAKRSIFVWTVNEESWMKWCIRKKVDGVITDDPKKYLEICDSYDGEMVGFSLKSWLGIILINFWAPFFSLLFKLYYDLRLKRRSKA